MKQVMANITDILKDLELTFDEIVKATCFLADIGPVSYTHLRAHETDSYLVCRLLLEKKNAEYEGCLL